MTLLATFLFTTAGFISGAVIALELTRAFRSDGAVTELRRRYVTAMGTFAVMEG